MRNAVPVVLKPTDVLLIVDVQNDFLPGGALAVSGGDAVITPANQCISLFLAQNLPIYASRDWHPNNHCSFKEQGGPWPVHCVAGTTGAAFSEKLRLPPYTQIICKATTAEADAYSAFLGTPLEQQLKAQGVKRIFIAGLATDYCVKNTADDALALGFEIYILMDAIAGINAHDSEQAIAQLLRLGAKLTTTDQLVVPNELVA